MQNLVHLHVHSSYSIMDGIASPLKLVENAKKKGFNSLAITEHGNLNSALKFYNACIKNDIKPIIGCEFYQTEFIGKLDENGKRKDRKKNHILVLAKNEIGYKNLLELNNLSFKENHYYYKPAISFKDLFKYKEGLIVTTACLASQTNRLFLAGKDEIAERIFVKFQKVFQDDFYLEVQINDFEEQKFINQKMIEFSQKLGIKIVVTGDVHWIEKKDSELGKMVLLLRNNETINKRNENFHFSNSLYLKTEEDFLKENELLGFNYSEKQFKEWFDNTREVSNKVNFSFPKGKHYPYFQLTDSLINKYNLSGKTEQDKKFSLLLKLCLKGLKKRDENKELQNDKKEEYKIKLKKELNVIKKLDYVDYFLIVWDLIKYSFEKGIRRGVGRGSAGGSLVSFLLKITDLDPVRWGTILERFLSVDRFDPPDIDLDFDSDKRYLIFEYLKNKYENIINIGTSQNFGVKNIIRDYARVYELDKDKNKMAVMEQIRKSLPLANAKPEDLEKIVNSNKDFEKKFPEIKKIIKYVKKLFGNPRSFGSHASGICVTDTKIKEILPINMVKKELVSGFEEGVSRELTEIGVTKFDILGLKTLSVIDKTMNLIKERYNQEDVDKIEKDFSRFDWIDDKKYIKELMLDNTGVFQYDSEKFYLFTQQLQPENYRHLIDANALFRPDILKSGEALKYLNRKNKGEDVPDDLKNNLVLKDIVKDTNYCFIFQEQIMFLLNKYFGFSMAEANQARKYISKKKEKEFKLMLDEKISNSLNREKFLKNKDEMNKLLEMLYKYGGYSFNYAHSVGYTLISMQCLYLKSNYRIEFFTALINKSYGDDKIKIYKMFLALKKIGIKILPIDFNKSKWEFTIEDGNIRAGFGIIDGMSYRSYQEIEKIRQENKKEFSSFLEIFDYNINWGFLNKKIIVSLIQIGVFDNLEKNRKKLKQIFFKIKENKEKNGKKGKKKKKSLDQLNLFKEQIKQKCDDVNLYETIDVNDYTEKEKITFEKNIIGFIYWNDVFAQKEQIIKEYYYKDILSNLKLKQANKYCVVYIEKTKTITNKTGKILHFLTCLDTEGNKEELLLFDNKFKEIKPKTNKIYVMDFSFYFDKRNGFKRYNIKRMKEL